MDSIDKSLCAEITDFGPSPNQCDLFIRFEHLLTHHGIAHFNEFEIRKCSAQCLVHGDADIIFLNSDPPTRDATIKQDLSRQAHPAVYCTGIVSVDPDVPEIAAITDHFGRPVVFNMGCNRGRFILSWDHQPLFAAPGDHPEITVIQGVVD